MNSENSRRWRLVLGRYADNKLGGLSGQDARADKALDYLYAREYQKRGASFGNAPGSLDPTQMNAIKWLGEAQGLFPQSVLTTIQDHALDRYGLTDLLDDPKTLEKLEPSPNLLKVLLSHHGQASPEVREKLRSVANQVIQEILERLRSSVMKAFSGRRNRHRRSNITSAANFDFRATIRANLKTWDAKKRYLIAEQLCFNSREQRHLPWRIILCVDQSGSMIDSLIYSAVMAAILTGLPGVSVKMVLFDTSIVDVSDKLDDPLETLLSVQLGGGTDIGSAVSYCEQFVDDGERTVFVLLSDFCEGASPRALYSAVARLAEARVKLVGLAALDEVGEAYYDQGVAQHLSQLGMNVAAMTPDKLAEWLAEIMS